MHDFKKRLAVSLSFLMIGILQSLVVGSVNFAMHSFKVGDLFYWIPVYLGVNYALFFRTHFTWVRKLRQRLQSRIRNRWLICFIITLPILPIDAALQMLITHPMFKHLIDFGLAVIQGGIFFAVLCDDDSDDETDLGKVCSDKIKELVERVRQVHGRQAVPVSS
jgi:hypothetical protein